MNADQKQKWVAALRSGDYVQGKHSLKTPNGFCCLGVLCEVIPEIGNVVTRVAQQRLADRYLIDDGLTKSWEDIPDLGGCGGDFGVRGDIESRLVSMNDDDNCTFAQIADYIEQEQDL